MEQHGVSEYPNRIYRDWNPRAFSVRVVEPEILRFLLEGALQTPSHLNEQPSSFIITTQSDWKEFVSLLSCLPEVSIEWVKNAPVLMLSVVRLTHRSNESLNKHAFRDGRRAISNIVLRARSLGLSMHELPGFDSARARRQFQIPSGYSLTSVIALGYPSELLVGYRQEQKGSPQRPLGSFVFTRSWGQPSPLLREPSTDPGRMDPGCLNTSESALVVG